MLRRAEKKCSVIQCNMSNQGALAVTLGFYTWFQSSMSFLQGSGLVLFVVAQSCYTQAVVSVFLPMGCSVHAVIILPLL